MTKEEALRLLSELRGEIAEHFQQRPPANETEVLHGYFVRAIPLFEVLGEPTAAVVLRKHLAGEKTTDAEHHAAFAAIRRCCEASKIVNQEEDDGKGNAPSCDH